MLPFTTKALRKAEVLEKTFGSQIPTEDIFESMEIQIKSTAGETSLSASNISQEPAPVNLIDKKNITATLGHKQNFRLASIDLDYPGPYEKLFDEPLNYDETPPLAGSVEEELKNVTDDVVTSQNTAPDNNGPRSTKIFKSGTDDRLFLRLSESDPLRELSGYALQTHLKAKLGSDDQLLSNILPTKTGFALCPSKGDFNLHHTRWQPSWSQRPTPGSENFVEWADGNYFCLLSPLDKKTHNRGNILDLALGSGLLLRHSKCCIATHLDATSDHLPLLTTIGWRDAPKTHQTLRPDSLNSTLFQNLLSSSIKQVAPVPSHSITDSLDKLAFKSGRISEPDSSNASSDSTLDQASFQSLPDSKSMAERSQDEDVNMDLAHGSKIILLPPDMWSRDYLTYCTGVLSEATRTNPNRVAELFATKQNLSPPASTRDPSINLNHAPTFLTRPAPPRITPYDGTSANLRAFCSQLVNQIQDSEGYFPTEISKVRFAYQFLGPGALLKMRFSFRCLKDSTAPSVITNLDEFIKALKQR
ncbi:hypothetical protein EPUL_005498 [Erysiphe pulchra]|uniref:Endonuclease/exonuclease/phosphatase domain-containing protein n=1 Tax=Erysiphe pulchra TaxID=225359 RepID=A0A2S4PK79_9PEZI|nr:hypothetical protein EPUL_005498 [Erysiphe pulchra]